MSRARTLEIARRCAAALSMLALLLPGDGALAETLRVVGSGNVSRILELARPGFETAHPDVRIEIRSRPSSSGPPALLRGEADLASMSRRMTDDELRAFEMRHGAPPERVTIGLDAVAVYVSAGNPLEQITIEQIDAAFSADRLCGGPAMAMRWQDLGVEGELAARRIGLYGHGPGSGTSAFFRANALCGGSFDDRLRAQPGGRSVVLAVAENPRAMGFSARAYRDEADVRALAIAASADGRYGTIEADDVYAGHYPLRRELYLYRLADTDRSDDAATAFISYLLAEEGQRAVATAGFLPLEPPAPNPD